MLDPGEFAVKRCVAISAGTLAAVVRSVALLAELGSAVAAIVEVGWVIAAGRVVAESAVFRAHLDEVAGHLLSFLMVQRKI